LWLKVVDKKSWTQDFVLLGTRQQGIRVILREMILPGGFDLVSPSFTVRDVTSELSGPRPTSCRTEM
uniref:CIA30 domain-containing protein n=1 Tax=Schistosoma curassoni TaxID=6186 RepID=A0A183KR94_9TREM